jgi:membrane-bound serine protease (ClpP class)
MKQLLFWLFISIAGVVFGQTKVVVFDIKEEIAPSATRLTVKALDHSKAVDADLVLVHMNTFGGLVSDADSIRTALLNHPIPVYVYIDDNAASAGALISLACDKIFMSPGATIGAASVVDQEGNLVPDKYQSYFRKKMQSTAEAQGYDTLINGTDTTYRYRRDTSIAKGFVDPDIVIPGLSAKGKVITLTTKEAIQYRYCEGERTSINDVLKQEGISDFELIRVEKSTLDKVIGFLANPAVSGILIAIMFMGVYFELQSPGVGFPIIASAVAAILYFAPNYLEGLAENWEILLFIAGIALILIEVFVIPGFGVAGISGIVIMITSLVLAMVRNVNFDFSYAPPGQVSEALASVLFALVGFLGATFIFGKGILRSRAFQRLVLLDTLKQAKSNTTKTDAVDETDYTGMEAITMTDLRPTGKIRIGNTILQARTLGPFISSGEPVFISRKDGSYWLVNPAQ